MGNKGICGAGLVLAAALVVLTLYGTRGAGEESGGTQVTEEGPAVPRNVCAVMLDRVLFAGSMDGQWQAGVAAAKFIAVGDTAREYSKTRFLSEWTISEVTGVTGNDGEQVLIKGNAAHSFQLGDIDRYGFRQENNLRNRPVITDIMSRHGVKKDGRLEHQPLTDAFNELIAIPNLRELLDGDRGVAEAQPGTADETTLLENKRELCRLYPETFRIYDGDPVFAIVGDWNPLPRAPVYKQSDLDAYASTITRLLAYRGVRVVHPGIKEAVIADLDGDGADETFIVASDIDGHERDQNSDAVSYSMIALESTVNGRRRIAVVTENYQQNVALSILLVADLDNDGIMEFIVNEKNAGASVRHLYRMSGDRVQEVIFDRLAP